MRVQNINNQQSFEARASFTPFMAPRSLRTLITPKLWKDTREFNLTVRLDETEIHPLIDNLLSLARQGKIKRSKQVIVPRNPYAEANVFELSGDTIVLYSKPTLPSKSASRIDIEHTADGDKGTTSIFQCKYFGLLGRQKDHAFDALAKALKVLPE